MDKKLTQEEAKEIAEHYINCELLHLACEMLEKVRAQHLPGDLIPRWIEEMKEESGLQIMRADEIRGKFS